MKAMFFTIINNRIDHIEIHVIDFTQTKLVLKNHRFNDYRSHACVSRFRALQHVPTADSIPGPSEGRTQGLGPMRGGGGYDLRRKKRGKKERRGEKREKGRHGHGHDMKQRKKKANLTKSTVL